MGIWFGNEAPRCAERAHPGAGGRQEGDSGHRRVRKGRDPSQRCLDGRGIACPRQSGSLIHVRSDRLYAGQFWLKSKFWV